MSMSRKPAGGNITLLLFGYFGRFVDSLLNSSSSSSSSSSSRNSSVGAMFYEKIMMNEEGNNEKLGTVTEHMTMTDKATTMFEATMARGLEWMDWRR